MNKKSCILYFSALFLLLLLLSPNGKYRIQSRYYCEALTFSGGDGAYTLDASLYEISAKEEKQNNIFDSFTGKYIEETFLLLGQKYPDTLYKSLKSIDVSALKSRKDKEKLLIFLFDNPHIQQKCIVYDENKSINLFEYLRGAL